MYYELSNPDTEETRSGIEMIHSIQYLVGDAWTMRSVLVDRGWREVDVTWDLDTFVSLGE